MEYSEAQKKITHTGSELNTFYLLKFAERLIMLVAEFPLWTGVVLPNDKKTDILPNVIHQIKHHSCRNLKSD